MADASGRWVSLIAPYGLVARRAGAHNIASLYGIIRVDLDVFSPVLEEGRHEKGPRYGRDSEMSAARSCPNCWRPNSQSVR